MRLTVECRVTKSALVTSRQSRRHLIILTVQTPAIFQDDVRGRTADHAADMLGTVQQESAARRGYSGRSTDKARVVRSCTTDKMEESAGPSEGPGRRLSTVDLGFLSL